MIPTFRRIGLICALVLTVAAPGTMAARINLVSFSYEIVPDVELDRYSNEASELHIAAQTYTAKLAVPVLLSGTNTALLNFLTFRTLYQTYKNVANAGNVYRPDYLYTFKYGLVFHRRLSDQWDFDVLLQPALLTDFVDVTSHHFVLRAGCLFSRSVSEKFGYGIGLGYSDDYGDEKLLPVFRMSWRPHPEWQVKLDLPQTLDIWYTIDVGLEMGLIAKVTGAHYRVGEEIDVENGNTKGGRVKYSILNAGPAIRLPLYKGLNIILSAGRSFYRRFEVFDVDDRELVDHPLENSFYFKAKLKFDVGR